MKRDTSKLRPEEESRIERSIRLYDQIRVRSYDADPERTERDVDNLVRLYCAEVAAHATYALAPI